MTHKQKIENLCKLHNIEIDVIDNGIGRNVDLLAPDGFSFQSGLHILCSPTWYTCKNELWVDLFEKLESELPLTVCECEDCILNETIS